MSLAAPGITGTGWFPGLGWEVGPAVGPAGGSMDFPFSCPQSAPRTAPLLSSVFDQELGGYVYFPACTPECDLLFCFNPVYMFTNIACNVWIILGCNDIFMILPPPCPEHHGPFESLKLDFGGPSVDLSSAGTCFPSTQIFLFCL